MPYSGKNFSADVGEIRTFEFDFSDQIASSETIVSVTWEVTIEDGYDPLPVLQLIGDPQLSGTITRQQIGGFTANVTYTLIATATTSLGNKASLWSYVTAKDPRRKHKMVAP